MGFVSESVHGERLAVTPECQMWPKGGKWKESSMVVSFYKA